MKTYKVIRTWTMSDEVFILATDKQDAKTEGYKKPLIKNGGEYLGDSMRTERQSVRL